MLPFRVLIVGGPEEDIFKLIKDRESKGWVVYSNFKGPFNNRIVLFYKPGEKHIA